MEIAILDTGIDRMHTYLAGNVLGGYSVIGEEMHYEDDNGHGTLCASVIKKEAPKAQFWVWKVLDNNNETTLNKLETALELLKESPVRLVHMSLSIMDDCNVGEVHGRIKELADQGKILVCSLTNGRAASYPAVYPEVLGVQGSILESDSVFWYDGEKSIQCIADSNPYLHAYPGGTYQLFGKNNSFASAKMTGIIASILEEEPQLTLEELKKRLSSRAIRNRWKEEDLSVSQRFPVKNEEPLPEKIARKTERIVKEFLEILRSEDLEEKILFSKSMGLTGKNCFSLIKRLEEELDCNMKDYTRISRYDLCFLSNIAGLMGRGIRDEI